MTTIDYEFERKLFDMKLKALEEEQKLYCNDIVAGLCKGRHEIPEVTEYVFPQELDPLDIEGMTATAEQFLEDRKARSLTLYVTGLTVACIAVINAARCSRYGVSVTLMHYDRVTGTYYPQKVF